MRIVRTLCASLFALATVFVGTEAMAQDRWSLYGGETVARGHDMIYGEFGWPDAGFGWAHGLNDKVDIGLRLGLIYGDEYRTDINYFGFDLRVPIRIQVARSGKLGVLLHIDPGLKMYTSPGRGTDVTFGPEFPIGVHFGYFVTPELTVGAGVDVNMFLAATSGLGRAPAFAVEPLFGPGVEYHVDHNFGVGADMKFGPAVLACRGCNFYGTSFGMKLQLGLMYHF